MLQLSCPGGRTNVVPAMDPRAQDVKIRFAQRTSRLRRFPLEQRIATLPHRTRVGAIVDVIV